MDNILELSRNLCGNFDDRERSVSRRIKYLEKIESGLSSALIGLRNLYYLEDEYESKDDEIESYIVKRRELESLNQLQLYRHNFLFSLVDDVDGKINIIRNILPEIRNALKIMETIEKIIEVSSDIDDKDIENIYRLMLDSFVSSKTS